MLTHRPNRMNDPGELVTNPKRLVIRLINMNFDLVTPNFGHADIKGEIIPFLTANILRNQNPYFQVALWSVFTHAASLIMVQENGMKDFFKEQAAILTGKEPSKSSCQRPSKAPQAQPQNLTDLIKRLKRISARR